MNKNYDPSDEEIEIISKSQQKRESHALQDFVNEIALMPKKKRSQLTLSQDMVEALIVADKIKDKPVAFRRHVNYMSKLMRDEDLEPIRQQIDFLNNKHQQQEKKHQAFEQLRDTLVQNGDTEIEALLEKHALLERQKLRQLIRQAKKEHEAEKLGKHDKALLQYLKECIK